MKVNAGNASANWQAYAKNIQEQKKSETLSESTALASAGEDRIVLSSRAKQILDVKSMLFDSADVREDRIARLKMQIEQGTYQTDGRQAADKMIRESLLNEVL